MLTESLDDIKRLAGLEEGSAKRTYDNFRRWMPGAENASDEDIQNFLYRQADANGYMKDLERNYLASQQGGGASKTVASNTGNAQAGTRNGRTLTKGNPTAKKVAAQTRAKTAHLKPNTMAGSGPSAKGKA